jgi:mRNA interferase RelE/StbE
MPTYRVRFLPYAKREFDKLPDTMKIRVRRAIHALALEPRPPSAKLLAGTRRPTWRLRVGDYRVLYEIHADHLVVLVVGAGHRRDVYRGRRISEIAEARYEVAAAPFWPVHRRNAASPPGSSRASWAWRGGVSG